MFRVLLLLFSVCLTFGQNDVDTNIAVVETFTGSAFRAYQQGFMPQPTTTLTPSTPPDPSGNDTQTIELTSQNDVALSILSNHTTNQTGNATIDDLVNQGRGLLADISRSTAAQVEHESIDFAYCFDDDKELVMNIYKAVQLDLIPVISEIKNVNTRSEYGFKALFKSARRHKYLQRIYEQTLVGALHSLFDKSGFGSGWKPPPQRPGFICVRDINDTRIPTGWNDLCTLPHVVASVKNLKLWIVLCPPWFVIPDAPTHDLCPTFPAGKPSSKRMPLTKQSVMVHEFAHLYLGFRSLRAKHDEVYDLNKVMALSSALQEVNAANYEDFYFCKYDGGIMDIEKLLIDD